VKNMPVYQFSDSYHHATLPEVGGKGISLIKMTHANLAIPPGFILTVLFFQPWIDELKKTSAWNDFLTTTTEEMPEKIKAVKAASLLLYFTDQQLTVLNTAVALHPEIRQFAVRSSSPEEDLSGASFAGGYETVLGVKRETMEKAIKTAFASCLDPRVFIYKKEQGFVINDFSIAVVIMEQVASEIAGVGFSVNPLGNDYDEMIFNANWGQGETVVSGMATPDQYVLNKISGKIIDKQLGKKETSIWLLEDGGTEERTDPRHDQFTLDDEQILELGRQLVTVEKLYERPMDIEWAYANNRLYLLQARPITTCIPLPLGMETAPDKPRRLYLDLTLSVQGLEKPLSVLGTDFLNKMIHAVANNILGRDNVVNIANGAIGISDGKMYLNLSNIFTVVNKDKMADLLVNMDALASDIIHQLPADAYKAEKTPEALNINKLSVAYRMYDVALKVFTGKYRLAAMAKQYDKDIRHFNQHSDFILASKEPLFRRVDNLFEPFAQLMVHKIVPAFILGQKSIWSINKQFAEDARQNETVKYHLDRVSRSLPHNLTIGMGLDIYTLSTFLNKQDYLSLEALVKAFENKQLPAKFYEAWDPFIKRFGCRGQEEIDIASARYSDNQSLLIGVIYATLTGSDETNNPLKIYQASQADRQAAYNFLLNIAAKKGRFALWKFKHDYAAMEQFGGYRENHKYFLIVLLNKTRQLVLEVAKEMVSKGVLDCEKQIFDLTFADMAAYELNAELDMKTRMTHNTLIIHQLDKVKLPPPLIDSRGRILRVKRPPLKEGEIGGHAVSSGKVSGKVKVLHTPDEKPLLAGEILVARATDPGWTPLFVNAAAIVLEVGGMLQHGALVAREYGKPCVAGVNNATETFKDGEMVEVDGTLGIIRRL